jgi:hypothetical protein
METKKVLREEKLKELGMHTKALMELSLEKPDVFTSENIHQRLMEVFEKYGFKEEWENARKSNGNR